ncbi:hypothetical protein HNP48_000972 [Acidovorax soli]|uniref:Uncharacterized protein n=1 Tax=Acidovorax soli TaxID=592050 RepID=A0A7X0PAI2_9BURK|nr:hypothetical protein [Acidovorax soli]MBB6558308.1 hypothetical protein [Acidovorax soli]
MKHLLLCAAFWLCAGLACANGAPRPGEAEASAPVLAHAMPVASQGISSVNADENAPGYSAYAVYMEQQRRLGIRIAWGLALAFAVFAGLTLRSRQPRLVRFSRMALWTPCFLLAGAWFFPAALLVATVFAPAIAVAWWKRALSWWELGIGSALYLPTVLIGWAVLLAMAGVF